MCELEKSGLGEVAGRGEIEESYRFWASDFENGGSAWYRGPVITALIYDFAFGAVVLDLKPGSVPLFITF